MMRHLEDHRDREENDRAADRALGEVAVRATQGFAKSRKDRARRRFRDLFHGDDLIEVRPESPR